MNDALAPSIPLTTSLFSPAPLLGFIYVHKHLVIAQRTASRGTFQLSGSHVWRPETRPNLFSCCSYHKKQQKNQEVKYHNEVIKLIRETFEYTFIHVYQIKTVNHVTAKYVNVYIIS